MKKILPIGIVILIAVALVFVYLQSAGSSKNAEPAKKSDSSNTSVSADYFEWKGTTISGLTDDGKKQTHITIPDSATAIGSSVFLGAKNLTSIDLGNKIEEIGSAAFWGCKLTSISFPSSLKKIDKNAFYMCSSLKTVTFSVGLKEIGENAFAVDYSLEKIELPEGLVSLGWGAFSPCSGIESIYLPASLENIPKRALWISTSATVYVKKGSWADVHFMEYTELKSYSKDSQYTKNYY